MLKKILVPLDGSDYSWSAARHAIQMAKAFRADIHGLSVTDVKIVDGQIATDLHVDHETAEKIYQDKGHALLEQLKQECDLAKVVFYPVTATGMVSSSICSIATDTRAELIAIGKHGINADWSGPLLGSTAESLIRQSKLSVLLAQENYVPISSVYVAYDGAIVSIKALRFTAELCAKCKWKMNVITIHRSHARREKLLKQAEETAELNNIKINKIGKDGDVLKQILKVTSQEPDALIVIGAYSRRLRELILGSVAERVVHCASQPVLIYRPYHRK
ncbi:MAG: Universal stress protein [Candidatus Poribacteria bacterium]|nr:Universal stress protein [Candidatus Poribacteria bacterium]